MATVPPAPGIHDAPNPHPRRRARTRAARAGTHPALVAGAGVLVVASYGLLLLGRDALFPLIDEDGWVESVGALALATAAALFLAAGIGVRPPAGSWPPMARVSLVALAALFAVGAGEEISWGQRQLGLDAPRALVEANAQGESNLHNLAAINGSVDDLFAAFILLFAIVLPLSAARWPSVRARARRVVPVFPMWVALLFLVNEAAFRVVWWGMPHGWYDGLHPFSQSAHEIRETVASVLFALAALVVHPPGRRRASGRGSTTE